MKPHQHNMRYASAVVGACFGLGIVGIAACSSSESAQGGKRVEFGHWAGGVNAGDAGDTGCTDANTALPDGRSVVSSDINNMGKQGIVPRFPSEVVEEYTGLKLSPEEKEIADICYRRPWSKNVPDRKCTKDNQCGDGFCDRGHCSAVYTCGQNLGFRCDAPTQCPSLLCINERCQSCVSDEECQKKMLDPYGVCEPPGRRWSARGCAVLGPNQAPIDVKATCDAAPVNKKPAYCPEPERKP